MSVEQKLCFNPLSSPRALRQLNEIFDLHFFHNSCLPGLLTNGLKIPILVQISLSYLNFRFEKSQGYHTTRRFQNRKYIVQWPGLVGLMKKWG